jgi:ABC-type branched-subunit amino acid transport system ATPase component
VLVSHDIPSVARIVDRVILIDRGAVVAELPCSELATHPIVRSVYIGEEGLVHA